MNQISLPLIEASRRRPPQHIRVPKPKPKPEPKDTEQEVKDRLTPVRLYHQLWMQSALCKLSDVVKLKKRKGRYPDELLDEVTHIFLSISVTFGEFEEMRRQLARTVNRLAESQSINCVLCGSFIVKGSSIHVPHVQMCKPCQWELG